jgi:hypothetical protein
VDVEPARLFGRVGPQSATFDRLFLLVSSESSEIAVEPVDPLDVGERMLFSLQHERLDFTAAYLKYRFSFPAAVNPFIEELEELERKALARAFAGKPAFVAHHPYPCCCRARVSFTPSAAPAASRRTAAGRETLDGRTDPLPAAG